MNDSAALWTQTYFGTLYGEIYSRHLMSAGRTRGEAAFATKVLKLRNKRVLDVAAGYGRHARIFARNNRVLALDQNLDYLKQAASGLRDTVAQNLTAVQGDMRRLPIASGSTDAAVLLFNSFGYFSAGGATPTESKGPLWRLPQIFYQRELVDRNFGKPLDSEHAGVERNENSADDNITVLQELARVLRRGGELLIEVPNPLPLIAAIRHEPRRRMVFGNYEIEEEFMYDESRQVLSNRTRFRSGKITQDGEYHIRLYRKAEITSLMKTADLKVKQVFGDYTGARFVERSSASILLHAGRKA